MQSKKIITGLRGGRLLLLAGSALAGICAASIEAQAGAFALREQSVVGQGTSFAGVAAGGALSSMFWNPAAMTQFKGWNVESAVSGIIPKASHSYTNSTLAGFGFTSTPNNSGDSALLPASYTSWQVNDRFWVGMSVNAPFGMGVSFPRNWAGAAYAQDAHIETYTFGPSAAFKVNDWISVGVGLQAQYATAKYSMLASPAPLVVPTLDVAGWSFGWTAGVTLTPFAGTQIGVGYRSAIDQKADGAIVAPSGRIPAEVTLNLPDIVSVGVRQRINDAWTVMGTVEWSNWSRIGTATVKRAVGSDIALPFNYSDGWFYSIGAEYKASELLTLRAGIGYEQSPITDDVRNPRLPDNDRMWFSAGASYNVPEIRGLTFDLSYSFVDVKEAPINIVAGHPSFSGADYVGQVDSVIHILSVGFRYKFDEPPKVLFTKG